MCLAATVLLVGTLGTTPGGAQAAPPSIAARQATQVPGVDEIASSPNIRQLANVPKQAPLDTGPGTDMAFQGNYAFVGNYNGFVIYDIRNPRAPQVVSQVLCPGGQNDVTVVGNLLILSTDSSRSNDSCNSVGQSATVKESWEGLKIFDVSDKRNPRYVKSVETNCGSHTHTVVPGKSRKVFYVYVSSYFPSSTFPDCQPPHDLISIVKVPVHKPTKAAVIATPNLFPDGGNPAGNGSMETTGCHDITAYPAKGIAAGACMGDGLLLNIRNPEKPRVVTRVRDLTNFAFWHSATFNNAGTKVVFTDELGGGVAAMCTAEVGPNRGANAIYDIVGRGDKRKLVFRSYYKIPRMNTKTENCVAHNGSLIPVRGRDIMVQAWYQGGVSVWDFTNSKRPVEIGYWERGPLSATEVIAGGSWSAYYYNGHIYSSDIAKGLDVLRINDRRTRNSVRLRQLNAQTQYPFRHR